MSNADDILFAPVGEPAKPDKGFNLYLQGEKVPDFLLKFDDNRVQVQFGVDAEVVVDAAGCVWVYPLEYLKDDECVVQITYPENHLFKNQNRCIISIDPKPEKRVPNHVHPPNVEAVRELYP